MQLTHTAKLSFALTGSAGGVINNGIAFFLLLYYSQVLGLDPALAGLALAIALVFDAVSDPLVGQWSDRLRSRWGRRHPFLFAAIIPSALFYYFLWVPPELSQQHLFLYMLVMTIALRLSLTLYSVPFNALLPELAPDYDQRTSLLNYSYSSGWFVGTLMSVAMYVYWLADTPEYPDGAGILRAEGYVEAGLFGAIIVFFCFAYAAHATRAYIPKLAAAPPSASVRQVLDEVMFTLRDRNIFAMLISGLFNAAALGTSSALWAYMQSYFWGFNSEQISMLLAAQLLSAVIAFAIMPILTSGRDKKPVLVISSCLAIVVNTGPVFLSLLGWFPPTGHEALFPTMLIIGVIQVTLSVITGVLVASMIADIVEAREIETGRREEGLLFSVQSFIGKVAGGVGIWAGGVMLALIEFPTETAATAVEQIVITRLGWLYGPALTVFYILSIIALLYYQLDRRAHEQHLRALGKVDS
ncbi:MAG: MFS transporter [Pseudomonadota bacterium]